MKVLRQLQPIPAFSKGTVTTVGNFDGVHRGHQALLGALRAEALRTQRPSVVLLFEPQPAEYFHSEKAPTRLLSLREKVFFLQQFGIDYVYCLRFSRRIASMQASVFAEQFIFSLLNAKYLLIGEDFRFGQDRTGNVSLLQSLSTHYDSDVQVFPAFFIDGMRVSSTQVRHALATAQWKQTFNLLGRPYSMGGRVMHGDARGRQWGVPTANIGLKRVCLPLRGVFFVHVKREKGGLFPGIANVGYRPTVDGNRPVLEVHLLETCASLYGEYVQVDFLEQLREEIKFPSVEALILQIHQDIKAAKAYFCANSYTTLS